VIWLWALPSMHLYIIHTSLHLSSCIFVAQTTSTRDGTADSSTKDRNRRDLASGFASMHLYIHTSLHPFICIFCLGALSFC